MNRLLSIAFASLLLLLQGCAVGKGISHVPDRESATCNDVTWYNPLERSISGWSVPYYIIPFWYQRWDHSNENLKVDLYFKIENDNKDRLSQNDLYLQRANSEEIIKPLSVKMTSSISHKTSYFLVYQSEFPIPAGELEEFEVIFKREIYGCDIKSIKYKSSEYDFNGTVL